MTGQIVAALLRGESVDTEELIHAETLTRVVKDLERVRSSRKWLKETRRVVSDRFKGIGRGTFPVYGTTRTPPEQPILPDARRFVIRPDLFLRHVRGGNWSVVLQLKSLRPIAAENPQLRAFLDSTRCRLNGASDWKPTGWLLSGDRKGAIRRWPDSSNPLIHFERPDPLMQHLLESEYRLQAGPVWLFRIGSDGIARHVASRTVRPAHDYIVVTDRTMPRELPKPRAAVVRRHASDAVLGELQAMLGEGVNDDTAAAQLNRWGHRDSWGDAFTKRTVYSIRKRLGWRSGIEHRRERLRERGYVEAQELAAQLGVCASAVRTRARNGRGIHACTIPVGKRHFAMYRMATEDHREVHNAPPVKGESGCKDALLPQNEQDAL